ncbi:MAG: hypothetical protein R3D51_04485 [Hyphomicrobiaceae bacterium]
MIMPPAGVFDDSSWYQPQAILYVGRRTIWDPELPGVPTFEGMPPLPPTDTG